MDEFPRRDQRCPSVDYPALDRAEAAAREAHPNAERYVAKVHAGEPYVEVWAHDRAKVWTPTAMQVLSGRA